MSHQGPGGWGGQPGYGGPPQQAGWGTPQAQHGGPQQGWAPAQPAGHGPQGAPGGPRPPAKKSGMSGCVIAIVAVLGVVLVSVGVGAWVFYREFGGFMSATGDVAKIMLGAQSAPGTDEMRDLGCTQAIAIDADELEDAIQKFEKEIAKREGRKPKPVDLGDAGVFLSCQTNDALDCQDVADAYRKAAKPKRKMLVAVTSGGGKKTSCSATFGPDGTKLGDAEAPDLPQ